MRGLNKSIMVLVFVIKKRKNREKSILMLLSLTGGLIKNGTLGGFRSVYKGLLQARKFNISNSKKNKIVSSSFQDILLSKILSSNKNHSDQDFIRCSIFNSKGDIIAHRKDIKRAKFMKEYNLVPRDFRKITRHHHGEEKFGRGNISVDIVPSISTRRDSILINLLNIKALIKKDTVIIFNNISGGSTLNETHSLGVFLKDMRQRLKSTPEGEYLPYEFRALECILVHVIQNLNVEMKVQKTVLNNVLGRLEESIDRIKLRYLLIQSKKITQFHQKTKLIRDMLNDILELDEELNSLYLTRASQENLSSNSHTEAEMLLESYYKTTDEIVQTVENLLSQIRTSEEIINIVLDSNRNDLMLMGIKVSVVILSLAFSMYIAALYGMNLENFIEEEDGSFEVVTVVGLLGFIILLFVSAKQLKRLQKVTMNGTGRHKH